MSTTALRAVVDADGHWISLSPALHGLLGTPGDDVPSGTVFDVIHPESEALVRRVVHGESALRESFGCQLALRDASTLWTYVRHARTTEIVDGVPVERVHLAFTYPVAVPRLSPVRSEPEDRFQAFFENSFDAVFLTTPDGSVLEANAAACAMVGFTVDELRARGRTAVVDGSDPRLAALLRDRETTGVARGRLTMRRKDGSRFEADLSSSVYYDQRGEARTSIVVRDLTEQIEAEQAARRESLELARRIEALTVQTSYASRPAGIYRALLDFAMSLSPAEAMLVAERAGSDDALVDVYAGWNMGGTAEEEVPPSVQSSVHSDRTRRTVLIEGRTTIVDDLASSTSSGGHGLGPPGVAERSRSAMILPMSQSDRIDGVVELRASRPGAFDDRHVPPLRLAATVAAISLRDLRRHERERQARKRAEASWRHLHEIVDQAPVMMATADGPDHVFKTANRRYIEALGLSPDIIGKSVADVFPEIQAQGIIDILDRVYTTGEPFVADGMPMDLNVHGEAERFYFNLAYQPIRDPDGRVTGILANVNDVTQLFRANEKLTALNIELREAYDQTIRSWGRALDIWDRDTAGHSQRVTDLAVRLGVRLGMDGDDLEYVRWGAQLHDIGKMAIPERILLKPGKLTEDEWEIMKTHTTEGAAFLEPIDYLRPAVCIPRHHHERWDGSGYPDGLAGEAIPLPARLFAVVDVYDALISERPYRAAWTRDQALKHVEAGSGSHFDPAVVEAFLAMDPHDRSSGR